MLQNNFFVTLIGLVMALGAISAFSNNSSPLKESFGMLPSFQVKVDRESAPSMAAAEKGQFYSVPGTYQAMLNPRFSSVNYGANIRYNFPLEAYQGVPCDPLTFSHMARENYIKPKKREEYGGENMNSPAANCRAGGMPKDFHYGAPIVDSDYASGNYNDLRDKAYDSMNVETTNMLPVGDMTSMQSDGSIEQPIIYDRYMYANRNNRLRSQGDPIRGDIPIAPGVVAGITPVNPNVDLQLGAMNVIGGYDNETQKALSELVTIASGGAQDTVGGVALSQTAMFTQTASSLGAGQNDVKFTAFP